MAEQFPLPQSKRTGFPIGGLIVTVLIISGAAAVFAFAAGWLSPHKITPKRFIDAFEQAGGQHPGFRRNHSKGVGISGHFDSNGQGVSLCKASVFKAGQVPVIGRFALAGGEPYQADAPHTVRSMALLFKLPDGQEWRAGMNNIPVFPFSTPQIFYEQLQASVPDPATGKPDPAKIPAFFAKYPDAAKAVHTIVTSPVSSGFDNSTYNSLDAFRFTSADGTVSNVRWAMVPMQAFEPPAATQPATADTNYLFDALVASIHKHPLQWHLIVTVANPGDPTNDSSIAWPLDRRQVDVGTLTIDQIESEETSPARDINFDPLILPDGMAGSDDPILSARSAVYAQSFTRREGEAKQPSAVSPKEVAK